MYRLLIIDEFCYLPFSRDQATAPTLDLTFGSRHQALGGDAVPAAAMLARLMHHATVVQIAGDNYRLATAAWNATVTLRTGAGASSTALQRAGRQALSHGNVQSGLWRPCARRHVQNPVFAPAKCVTSKLRAQVTEYLLGADELVFTAS